jgi:5-methyltetrahydrofolate--homocysteine methyltransferase
VRAGSDYLDLNVDEISLKLPEQIAAIEWLVRTVESLSPIPIAVDSSNVDILRAGLAASTGKPMLNSASLERLDALDTACKVGVPVVVTAAGESGMPQDDEERVANASRMVDAALALGLPIEQLYIDPLVFPISVDSAYGNHCLDAIRKLRAKYGPAIHISGGLSNVSFGLPCRKLINEVFLNLAAEAGADSGIVDPVANDLNKVFTANRDAAPYKLAEDMLLGRDRNCKVFLRAYRKGELG